MRFATTTLGGIVKGAVQKTNEKGIATVGQWVLGPKLGQNVLVVEAEGVEGKPLTFVATANRRAEAKT